MQVEHLDLAYVCCATKLVEIPVSYYYQAWRARSLIEIWQLVPFVTFYVKHLAGSSTCVNMPRSHDDKELFFPAYQAVGVSGVMHVSESTFELHGSLIKYCCGSKVGLGASDCSTGHVDLTIDLNALLIPQVEEICLSISVDGLVLGLQGPHSVFSGDLDLALGVVQDVKQDYVVLVQEVQPGLVQAQSASLHQPGDLDLVEEPVEQLEAHLLLLAQVLQDHLEEPGPFDSVAELLQPCLTSTVLSEVWGSLPCWDSLRGLSHVKLQCFGLGCHDVWCLIILNFTPCNQRLAAALSNFGSSIGNHLRCQTEFMQFDGWRFLRLAALALLGRGDSLATVRQVALVALD